jgi:ABC-type sugar transport system substrate-binding protein
MSKSSLTAAAAAAVIAVTALSGCAGPPGQQGAKSAAGQPLAMVGLYNNPYPNNIAAGAKAAAEEDNSPFTQYGPAGLDPNKAISDFQNAVAAGAKGILVMAYPGDLWTAPINRAVDQGVTVAMADVFSEKSKAVTEVGAPKVAMGAALAEEYIKQIPEGTEGVIIPGLCVAGLRVLEAPLDGFRIRMEEKRPGIKVPDPEVTAGDPAANFAAWQRIAAKYPDAVGFVGACDVDLPNLIKLKESQPGAKYLTGTASGGDDPTAVEAISRGALVGAVTQRSWLQGYVGMKLIANSAFRGEKMPEGWINTGFDIVTKDNVDGIMEFLTDPAAAKAEYQALGEKLVADAQNIVHKPMTYQNDVASINEPTPVP